MSEFDDIGGEEPTLPSIIGLEGITDPATKKFALAVKEILEVRLGTRPRSSQLDRGLTFRDLHKYNIAAFVVNGQTVTNPSPEGGIVGVGNDGSGGAGTPIEEEADLTTPGAPLGLLATGTKLAVLLEWDEPASNIAYAEVHRAAVDNIGEAVLIGTTEATIYVDIIGATEITNYYWIRFVSKANITGAFNAISGTVATTGKIGSADLISVDGAKIIDATILNAKIANVSADKITTGTLAVGQAIQVGDSANRIFIDGNGIIRTGGMLDYLNGSGFYLRAAGGTAQVSFGNSTNYIGFDGSNVNIVGNIRNGQSAYGSGTGLFSGVNNGNVYQFSVGNGINQYIHWSGTEILIQSSNFSLTSDQLTFNGTGTYSGALNGATGSFAGLLEAGVLDFSKTEGIKQNYLSAGIYILTVPVGKTTMRVSISGGSGGGGGAGNVNGGGGGGGGSTGILIQTFTGLTEGATYTLTVGNKGFRGERAPYGGNFNNLGQDGTDGGNTSIAGLITSIGGKGGQRGQNNGTAADGGLAGTNGQSGFSGEPVTAGGSNGVGCAGGASLAGNKGGKGGDARNTQGNSAEDGKLGFALIEFFNPNSVVLKTEFNDLLSKLIEQGIDVA